MLESVSPDFTRYSLDAAASVGFGVGFAVGFAVGAGVATGDGSGVGPGDVPGDGAVDGLPAGCDAVGPGDMLSAAAPPEGLATVPLDAAGDCVRAITRTMKASTMRPTRSACPPPLAPAPGSAPMRRAGSRTTGVEAVADHSAAPSSPGVAGTAADATSRAAR
jgi:hypothetical protein